MHLIRTAFLFAGALAVTVPVLGQEIKDCPAFAAGAAICTPEGDALTELSGLLDSRKHPGVFWAHNDSGDGAYVYAFSHDGMDLGIYTLDGVVPEDWEDMAFGPGPDITRDYLYIGDFGNNGLHRSSLLIYRIPEPEVHPLQEPQNVLVQEVDSFVLTYPFAPVVVYDCETLLVDPVYGDIYLVSKDSSNPQVENGLCHVFRKAAPHVSGETAQMEEAGTLLFAPKLPGMVTAGDVSPAGDEILIRSYLEARLWQRAPGELLHQAFLRAHCSVPLSIEIQGEAIAFAADGSGYYSASEAYILGMQPVTFYARTPETEGEGASEGEGSTEGEGDEEGEGEGQTEGTEGEGWAEGEGEDEFHAADPDQNARISLTELLRVIQFFNTNGLHCEENTEDGYAPGPGTTACAPHDSDYNPQDWQINLAELLRLIQLFNSGGYHACPDSNPPTEDRYCPGA